MRVTGTCLLVVGLGLLLACGGGGGGGEDDAGTAPDGAMDAGMDAPMADAGQLWRACEETEPAGTSSLPFVPSTLVATIAPMEASLAEPGELNPVTLEGELAYAAMGFGEYAAGPGQPRVQRTDLGGETAFGARRSLTFFTHLADSQLVDDESPARIANLDSPEGSGAIRAQEAYVPRALSAMARTLGQVEEAARPLDFGVVSGDCTDNGQLNELRWFIDTLDGRTVDYDSGEDDDPLPGPDNDPKDPFDAVAFPAPWLFVPGNHDVEVVGIFPPTMAQIDRALGTRATLGARDYRRPHGAITRGTVPADPMRLPLQREEIVAELRDSPATPGPVGHGYPEDADLTHGASYVYDAVPGLLRIVGFDTNDLTGGSIGMVLRSTVEEWLEPALAQAEEDGVLVILASHHSTLEIDTVEGEAGDVREDAVPGAELEAIVAAHPQVIAWMVGHEHFNRVRAIPGAEGTPGYWEIMTSSLVDWPQQMRLMELVDNGNGTLSLFATLLDYATESCMERRYRRLGLMEFQSGWGDSYSDDPNDLNVELVVPTPASAADAVAAASAGARIESLTSLAGE